jgi:NAD(P)-dependent dehydrogenase (short-subunit alcohol dehydrogenase family)
MSLEGKIAIVTGGMGALGTAVVRRFQKEGVKTTITVRRPKDILEAQKQLGSEIVSVSADVTIEQDVQRLFEEVRSKLGRIDIVVNTVGGFLPQKSIAEASVDEWNHMMEINLKSAFLCSREALRSMNTQSYGRIVNISSMAAFNPTAGRAPYAISKFAVAMLTDISAQEVKGKGITINAIAPSIIDTQANRDSMPNEDFTRWVKPDRIADTICFLCSDAASDISGTTLKMMGGI